MRMDDTLGQTLRSRSCSGLALSQGMARPKLEAEVLALTNAFRSREGQTPLQMHEAGLLLNLAKSATRKVQSLNIGSIVYFYFTYIYI